MRRSSRRGFRLGAEWAPAQADIPARNQGFVITRSLRTATGAATTSVPAGKPIAMDLRIESRIRVRYVVIDVPLPSGLEGVSRTLGKAAGPPCSAVTAAGGCHTRSSAPTASWCSPTTFRELRGVVGVPLPLD